MSTTSTTQILNPQKRKRTVVSYAQVDPLADLLIDDEDVTMDSCPESSDDESDNDDRTYSRRRKIPKKTTKNKKARHTPTRRQPEQKPFPFMELPPELRDMIYEMALTDVDGMSIASTTKNYRRTVCRIVNDDMEECRYRQRGSRHRIPEGGNAPKQLATNLLAVSKQIHNETISMLYGHDFIFADTDTLHRFLTVIGTRNQQRLRSIDIQGFCTGRRTRAINHCAFMALVGATNLKALIINNDEFRHYSSPKHLARGLYSNIHFFLEAYGAAHGLMDAGIDIIELDEYALDYFHSYRRGGVPAKQQTPEENKVIFRAELCRLLGAKR